MMVLCRTGHIVFLFDGREDRRSTLAPERDTTLLPSCCHPSRWTPMWKEGLQRSKNKDNKAHEGQHADFIRKIFLSRPIWLESKVSTHGGDGEHSGRQQGA